MTWLYLVLAGLFEIMFAVALKFTHGFTNFWPTAFVVLSILASIFLLSIVVKTMPVSMAYAIWVGIGATGTIIVSIFLFNEPVSVARVFFLSLIVIGIIGLKLAD